MRRILWFRRDLRIDDNPLLSLDGSVLPIFIFDTNILTHLPSDDRRITFIYQAVMRLKTDLQKYGLDLAIFYGSPVNVFNFLLDQEHFDEVSASGDYDPYALSRDRDISHLITFNYLHDTYIFKPDEVLKPDGTPYLVFTPFYKRAINLFSPLHMYKYDPVKQQRIDFDYNVLHIVSHTKEHSTKPLVIDNIGFTPQILSPHQINSPQQKLLNFEAKLPMYSKNRDFIAIEGTSGLSADLRFGTLSIRSLLRWLEKQKKSGVDTEPFFRQLVFREFYAMLIYHFPYLTTQNFRYPFHGIENHDYFEAFCHAKTGVPIIDAGIMELIKTGEMHNRVRMIAASFFTKNLLLPWQWGEAFFAKHLMDYDLASNVLSWQWSSGTGVDPQPYFRIFNPYTQAEKYDKDNLYRMKFISKGYDLKPIVDHNKSSQKALEYFKSLRK